MWLFGSSKCDHALIGLNSTAAHVCTVVCVCVCVRYNNRLISQVLLLDNKVSIFHD